MECGQLPFSPIRRPPQRVSELARDCWYAETVSPSTPAVLRLPIVRTSRVPGPEGSCQPRAQLVVTSETGTGGLESRTGPIMTACLCRPVHSATCTNTKLSILTAPSCAVSYRHQSDCSGNSSPSASSCWRRAGWAHRVCSRNIAAMRTG